MDVLFISTADWDNPYWTNKQHVAVELGRRGHRLLYVESQGLRRPTATGRDLKRIFWRLIKGLRAPRRVTTNVWVWSPLTIPFQGMAPIRRLNKLILKVGIFMSTRWTGMKPEILWTYSPMTTELYDTSDYEVLVYHAVDDVKQQPGMPFETIQAAETALSMKADIVFTSAPRLQEVHSRHNEETHFHPNVADYAHFNSALEDSLEIPEDLKRIPSPRLGFIGAISSYKLDFELLAAVAKAKPDWSIVMIGEVGEGDPSTDVSILNALPNVHLLGGRPYRVLPAYLKGFDIALLPNLINEYTRSMFPMKFFEYLAAGRRVIATEIPSLKGYESIASFCVKAEDFIATAERMLKEEDTNLDARLKAARENTYEKRTEEMLKHLEEVRRRKGI